MLGTVKEFATILDTFVPIVRPAVPELSVSAPKRVVAPTSAPNATVPLAPAVKVSAWLPAEVPWIVEVAPEKVMLADPETVVLSTMVEAARRVVPVTVIAPPDVERLAPRD